MNGKVRGFVRSNMSRVIIPGRIKEFTVLEAVEDGGKHHACNGNDSTLVSTTTLDLFITLTVVREFRIPEHCQCTLHE